MIRSIEMVNWRIFDRQRFNFDPGITFLMGLNGRGKTSILEAIGYALTGEPVTVSDRTKLLRDPERRASVKLVFDHNDYRYVISRSQSNQRAEAASMRRLRMNMADELIADSHRAVTKEVERLLGVSADFLGRIVYMSEGDVFRFLRQPPRKALDQQIRQVLGLTELDEFIQAVQITSKEFQDQIKVIQGLIQEAERIATTSRVDTNTWQEQVRKKRGERLANLRFVEEKITLHRIARDDLSRIEKMLEGLFPFLKADPERWREAQEISLSDLYVRIQYRLELAQVDVLNGEKEIARLEGEQFAYKQTLDLLKLYSEKTDTVPCPVCGKPMTYADRENVNREIEDDIQRLDIERRKIGQQVVDGMKQVDTLFPNVRKLEELIREIDSERLDLLTSRESIAKIEGRVGAQLGAYEDELIKLQSQAELIEQEIKRLDDENAEYAALNQRLDYQGGYGSLEDAKRGLIEMETRLLSLRAAKRAADEVLTDRRNVDMDAIYSQMAKVWSAFTGADGWHMELDQNGIPILEDGESRQLDLSQFSGGEKTALLVILHTIIAQHFSDTDFLLIDEPLEHLDAVNRRSLIRFLVSACRLGRFGQAIVATFEESLIRKYMSDEDVNVIHL